MNRMQRFSAIATSLFGLTLAFASAAPSALSDHGDTAARAAATKGGTPSHPVPLSGELVHRPETTEARAARLQAERETRRAQQRERLVASRERAAAERAALDAELTWTGSRRRRASDRYEMPDFDNQSLREARAQARLYGIRIRAFDDEGVLPRPGRAALYEYVSGQDVDPGEVVDGDTMVELYVENSEDEEWESLDGY